MSRSIHHTRKSASRALVQGNLEPIKEYSLKSDIKKWSKKAKKVRLTEKKLIDHLTETQAEEKTTKLRNAVLVSALKKVKKPLERKLDKKYG